jgi:hypothetical protein
MAMVGLFWITESSVYVGAEPEGYGRSVRLTPIGVEGLGTGQQGIWGWSEVGALSVHYARVRSGARWLVGTAVNTVLDAATGGGDIPGAFEVHVETKEGATVELTTYTAAVNAYHESEYELSVALLERITAGVADVSALLAWGREHAAEGTPGRDEREALLRAWMEG